MRFPLYFFFLSSAVIASHSAPAFHARRALRLRDIVDVVGGAVSAVDGAVNGVVGECFFFWFDFSRRWMLMRGW